MIFKILCKENSLLENVKGTKLNKKTVLKWLNDCFENGPRLQILNIIKNVLTIINSN